MEASPLHIVVFPWLAFGHLHPCLELADRLASRGHRVSFLSTPRNIARLRRPAPTAGVVEFVDLPFPRVDGLPDGAEATFDVPAENSAALLDASDGLAAPFSAFLDGEKKKQQVVDWVILDSLHHWAAAAAAADRNVPCVLMMPYSATACAHFGVPTPSEGDFPSAIARRFVSALEGCRLLAVRSCVEFEPEPMAPLVLPRIFGKPAIPIGLLPPQINACDTTCTSWLDTRPPNSVVYVALGSEAPLSAEQLRELALGLELSGAPFLWALRKPHRHAAAADDDDADDVTQLLPPGFEERTGERGTVRTGWVPQLKILAHAAVGAFLTHCGYSSVIEGLRFGHPLVMLPLFLDHFVVARYLEGVKKVGVQVPRADETFDRDGVAGAVRAAVVDEERRKVFAANAKNLQEVVADTECHERYIDGFIQQLRSYKYTCSNGVPLRRKGRAGAGGEGRPSMERPA